MTFHSVTEPDDRKTGRYTATALICRLIYFVEQHEYLCLTLIVTAFAVLATALAFARYPWCDEGWFADILYNLTRRGVMAMSHFDPHGFIYSPYVKGVDRYIYSVLPGYFLAQSVWTSIFGLSAPAMRLMSTLWGVVALISSYALVKYFCQSRITGLLSTAILALDQNFLLNGANARMDMMCAALCLAGPAIYLQVRSRFDVAVGIVASVLAIALLTHPNAVFGVLLFALMVLVLDRHRIRLRTILIAGAPFLVLVSCWVSYVMREPDTAFAQLKAQANTPHRFEVSLNLMHHISGELQRRYLPAYHLTASTPTVAASGVVVILYFIAPLAMLSIARTRVPGSRLISIFGLISFALLSCLQETPCYLVYILPVMSAALAVCLASATRTGKLGYQIPATAAVTLAVLLNLGPTVLRIHHQDYRTRYNPTIEFLKRNATADDLIMGSADLSFGLGFEAKLLDDCRLGYASGKKPAFIVFDPQYYQWLLTLATQEPRVYDYITSLLKREYQVVYDQQNSKALTMPLGWNFVVYRRVFTAGASN